MLLKGYRKKISRPKCNPAFESVHCIAHLDIDIGQVLPYLNTLLGGTNFTLDPPSVTLQFHGKLITIHSRQIAINALRDEEEADKILTWLREQINVAWERRNEITPSFKGLSKPRILEILRLLPQTSCGECGQKTCLVFATLVSEGAKGPEDCPALDAQRRIDLEEYLRQFSFEP